MPEKSNENPQERRKRDGNTPNADAANGTATNAAAANGGTKILEARGITKVFGGLVAVDSVDFDIPERAIVSLIGSIAAVAPLVGTATREQARLPPPPALYPRPDLSSETV